MKLKLIQLRILNWKSCGHVECKIAYKYDFELKIDLLKWIFCTKILKICHTSVYKNYNYFEVFKYIIYGIINTLYLI